MSRIYCIVPRTTARLLVRVRYCTVWLAWLGLGLGQGGPGRGDSSGHQQDSARHQAVIRVWHGMAPPPPLSPVAPLALHQARRRVCTRAPRSALVCIRSASPLLERSSSSVPMAGVLCAPQSTSKAVAVEHIFSAELQRGLTDNRAQ